MGMDTARSTDDTPDRTADDEYVLGHSAHELGRLSAQARLYAPFIVSFLRAAGIAAGMRVLDVGCGGGDVSMLVSRLVGRAGAVVGIDRSATAIETADRRAKDLSAQNMRFLVADASAPDAELAAEGPFDAAIGRSVLEFVPDPAGMLRTVATLVRPGGVVAFQEADWSGCRARPEVPTLNRCVSWGIEALQRAGADPYVGLKLHTIFTAAGLPPPELYLQAVAGAGPAHPLYAHIAGLMRTLLPTIDSLGAAGASEVDVETLEQRLGDEVVAAGATIVWVSLIGAASRTPAEQSGTQGGGDA
jgi:SAM-dependent methyltransferase